MCVLLYFIVITIQNTLKRNSALTVMAAVVSILWRLSCDWCSVNGFIMKELINSCKVVNNAFINII